MGKLATIYAAYLTSTPDRPPNGHISVSQVLGCPHYAWHEQKLGLKKTFDAPTQSKFAMGHAVEANVRAALVASGYQMLDNPPEGVPVDARLDVWGHPDIVALGADDLVEVKSTSLRYDFKRKGVFLPTQMELEEDQPQYFLQGAAYAHAYAKTKASVFLVDRGTGIFDDYPINVDRWYAHFHERAIYLVADLAQAEPPNRFYPDWTEIKGKGYGYVCRGCPVSSCPKWSLAN